MQVRGVSSDIPAPARAIAGIGRVLLWSGGSLWIGRDAGRAQAHSHHAIQISLALSGKVRLRSADRDIWSDYVGAIVRPHHRHQFDGCGETVAQVFVEPETFPGRVLLERYRGSPIHELPEAVFELFALPLRRAFSDRATNEVLVAIARRSLADLCGGDFPETRTDPRVSHAIEFVRSRLSSRISLAEAAAVAHLSPSRFRHLFVAQTGISFRAYLLWARVEAAVGTALGGRSWTEAAHLWGFADSAHLSRTCRRMFGISPASLIGEPSRN